MKKVYVAPDLCFESYVLSRSIAGGCTDAGMSILKEYNDEFGYFNTTANDSRLQACSEQWDDSVSESYCYWQGSIKLFLS